MVVEVDDEKAKELIASGDYEELGTKKALLINMKSEGLD